MITSLNIKNIATYDGINGVQINDLKTVNFFFGFNGSGKSTIAKYLRNLSLDSSIQNQLFTQCSNTGYDKNKYQVLTFNEEFIQENFRNNNELKGVFSLNQQNTIIDQQIIVEQSKIQKNESLKTRINERQSKIEVNKKKKYEQLLNHCWNQRTTFSAFTKITLANAGSKPNHLQEIKRILSSPLQPILSVQKLTELYNTHYEKDLKEVIQRIDKKSYLEFRRLEKTLGNMLQEIIIGNEDVDIAALIQTLNSRSWIDQGVKFLKSTGNTCPFCQKKTIDSDLKEQFNKLFDETYKRKISEIEGLKEQYKRNADSIITNITSIQNNFNPNNIVSNLIIDLKSFFEENIRIIEYKIQNSHEKKTILSIKTRRRSLSEIVDQIKGNNKLYSESDTHKKYLLKEIWNFIAAHCQHEISKYDKLESKHSQFITHCDKYKSNHDAEMNLARQTIETLRSQTVNTKEAVDNINIILKNSGFEGFEIDEKQKINNISRYYLKRPNNTSTNPVFASLSEGEKNFISFLYFYQLCLGTDDIQSNGSKKKIIVIDDPVSSLDSQALFIVSTLIHSIIKGKDKPNKKLLEKETIAQIFILTHNFYFYKEVSFEKRPICVDNWHFKIVKLNNKTSVTGSSARTVQDDYSLMWRTIKEIKSNLPQSSSLNIMISNSMRRIIESYLNFIGYKENSAWGAILNEDQSHPSYNIKCSFISTINDESHKVTSLDSMYYQKITSEQPQILFDVFAAIFRRIGREHYEKMMGEQLVP